MKGKKLVILALALGVVVVILVNIQFSRLERKANPETTTFYRALRAIPAGLKVEEAVGERDPYLEPIFNVPLAFAKALPNAVDTKKLEYYMESSYIVRPVQKGSILRIEHLSEFSTAEITKQIPAGQVAVAIEVTRSTSVGYLATPGDRVDVYLHRSFRDDSLPGGVRAEASVVAQDVLVLAVDGQLADRQIESTPRRGEPYGSVTVATTPDSVRAILSATELGTLTLTMRSSRAN